MIIKLEKNVVLFLLDTKNKYTETIKLKPIYNCLYIIKIKDSTS